MVVVIMEMRAQPGKGLELIQTLRALIESIRKEKGCLGYEVLKNIENETHFCLVEHWESRKDLDDHRRSDRFAILMGTRSLLEGEPEILVSEVPQ